MLYPKATAVTPLEDYMLKIKFDNGETGFFDVKPYIKGEWFGALKDKEYFQKITIAGLSVAWPDGQDIAPDCLYANSVKSNLSKVSENVTLKLS